MLKSIIDLYHMSFTIYLLVTLPNWYAFTFFLHWFFFPDVRSKLDFYKVFLGFSGKIQSICCICLECLVIYFKNPLISSLYWNRQL